MAGRGKVDVERHQETLQALPGRHYDQIPGGSLCQRFRIIFLGIPILTGRQLAFVRQRWQRRPFHSSQKVEAPAGLS